MGIRSKKISSDCDPAINPLTNMIHYRTEPNNHEAIAERSNRTIQDRYRTIYDSLPYKLPKKFTQHLITYCCHTLNIKRHEQFTHHPIHPNTYRYAFGDVLLFKSLNKDKAEPKAIWGLILGKEIDGLLLVLNLETGELIHRREGVRVNTSIDWNNIQQTLIHPIKFKQYTSVVYIADSPTKARQEELSQLITKGVINPIYGPPPNTILPTKMIIKLKDQGYKGRLVARGDLQEQKDITDGPTIHTSTILIILCLATSNKHHICVMDVTGAYLNAMIDEDIGIKLSKKDSEILHALDSKYLPDKQGTITVRLSRALYGLKQSALLWYITIKQVLVEQCKLKVSSYDPCLYFSSTVILGLYVDDILITYKDQQEFDTIVFILEKQFNVLKKQHLSSANMVKFRGLNISQHEQGLIIDQKDYAMTSIVEEFNKSSEALMLRPTNNKDHLDHTQTMINDHAHNDNENIDTDNNNPTNMHFLNMDDSINLSPEDHEIYTKMTNKIGWLASQTRCDLKFTFSILSARTLHPTYNDMNNLKHTIKYIERTTHYGLKTYQGPIRLHCYADASYGLHRDNRASHTGIVTFLGNTPIISISRKQKNISLSSHEAELYSANEAIKTLLSLKGLLEEINDDNVIHSPAILFQDNKSTIRTLTRDSIAKNSKHIQVRYHHMKQTIHNGDISLQYINTEEMIADIHTKVLPNNIFNKLRHLLMEEHHIPPTTNKKEPDEHLVQDIYQETADEYTSTQ